MKNQEYLGGENKGEQPKGIIKFQMETLTFRPSLLTTDELVCELVLWLFSFTTTHNRGVHIVICSIYDNAAVNLQLHSTEKFSRLRVPWTISTSAVGLGNQRWYLWVFGLKLEIWINYFNFPIHIQWSTHFIPFQPMKNFKGNLSVALTPPPPPLNHHHRCIGAIETFLNNQ